MSVNLIGFDSAWAGNSKVPGAICGACREGDGPVAFHPPRLVGFDAAAAFIKSLHHPGDLTLVAIDQPTIVRNPTGMRPAERVVASLISWSGGGIQPAYREKPLFGDDAPIWRFLGMLESSGCVDDPERAARAHAGLFVMEVYPALALLSLDDAFMAARGARPSYNPGNRRRFRHEDWCAVCSATSREGRCLGLDDVAAFGDAMLALPTPRKGDQDRLDAAICLLVAKRWRDDRESCAMIGDTESGYIVAPVSSPVRARLEAAATGRDVTVT